MKHIATLDLTPELFIEFCQASKDHNGHPRRFTVIENPLPDDAEVVGIIIPDRQPSQNVIQLEIASASFPEGRPRLPLVVYRTIFS